MYQQDHPDSVGLHMSSAIIVDRPEENIIDYDKPLVLQRTHGYFEDKYPPSKQQEMNNLENVGPVMRSRLIHNQDCGLYYSGRHCDNLHPTTTEDLVLCWFGLSPWEHVIYRKIQMYDRISDLEHKKLRKDMGGLSDRAEDLDAVYPQYQSLAYELMSDARYRKAYGEFL